MLTLGDFRTSKMGTLIGAVLARGDVIRAMERLSVEGRPAVLALDAALPVDAHLDRNEKQHAGRMIRDRLGEGGWRVATRRPFRGGRIFASGAVFTRPASFATIAVQPQDDWAARIAAAQELVRQFSTSDYSVDDFIADKRAEAAAENKKWR